MDHALLVILFTDGTFEYFHVVCTVQYSSTLQYTTVQCRC